MWANIGKLFWEVSECIRNTFIWYCRIERERESGFIQYCSNSDTHNSTAGSELFNCKQMRPNLNKLVKQENVLIHIAKLQEGQNPGVLRDG